MNNFIIFVKKCFAMTSQFNTDLLTQFVNAKNKCILYSDIIGNIPGTFLSVKTWSHLALSLWVSFRVINATLKPYTGNKHGYDATVSPAVNSRNISSRDMEFAKNVVNRFKNRVQTNMLLSRMIKEYMSGCVSIRSCTGSILLRDQEWLHIAEIITKATVVFMFPTKRTIGLHNAMLDAFSRHNTQDTDGKVINGIHLFEMVLYNCRLDRCNSTSVYVDLYMYISQFYDKYVTQRCTCSHGSVVECV